MINDAWLEYRAWAKLSRSEQASVIFWGRVILALTCLCAILAAAASYSGVEGVPVWVGRTLSFASAAAAAVAGAIGAARLRSDHEKIWITARGVAEAIKSECFLRAAASGDYAGDNPDEVFRKRWDAITAKASDIAAPSIAELTKDDPPCPPIPLEPSWYQENRLLDQRKYYTRAAEREHSAAERFKYVSLGLSVLAAVFGVLAGSLPALRIEIWIGVITTLSAALATYAMIDRRRQMALAYSQTATKLNRLNARFGSAGAKLQLGQLVKDAEDIILAENRAWSDIMTQAPAPAPVVPAPAPKPDPAAPKPGATP